MIRVTRNKKKHFLGQKWVFVWLLLYYILPHTYSVAMLLLLVETVEICFLYQPSEACRSCIFLIFSAFHNYWWLLTLLLVKKGFFRISPCLVMCKRLLKMQNRLPHVVFSHCLQKFSLILTGSNKLLILFVCLL